MASSIKSTRPTRLKGAFINGLWHCDCNPRLPAEHFQTKNGGKNHGRWFHTCQQPTNRRCGFFLWSDDAKHREEAAVLGGGRTEPNFKDTNGEAESVKGGVKEVVGRGADRGVYELKGSFPNLNVRREGGPGGYAENRAFASHDEEAGEGEQTGWSNGPLEYPPETKTNRNGKGYESSEDEGVQRPGPSTPRKERRLEGQTSPSKGRDKLPEYGHGMATPQTTTTTTTRSGGTDTVNAKSIARLDLEHDLSFETPTPRRFHDLPSAQGPHISPPAIEPFTPSSLGSGPPPLAKEILMLLSDSDLKLTPYIIEAVNRLCRTAQLREHAMKRGRDVVREKLQEKEKEIAKMAERVKRLEMDLKVKGEVNAALRKELEKFREGEQE